MKIHVSQWAKAFLENYYYRIETRGQVTIKVKENVQDDL